MPDSPRIEPGFKGGLRRLASGLCSALRNDSIISLDCVVPLSTGEILTQPAQMSRRCLRSHHRIPPAETNLRPSHSDFCKEHPCQIRRAINLFERALHHRTERVVHQSPQRNIPCRARETLGAGQLDGSHAQAFNVARVTNGTHRDPVVNFKDLLPRRAKR